MLLLSFAPPTCLCALTTSPPLLVCLTRWEKEFRDKDSDRHQVWVWSVEMVWRPPGACGLWRGYGGRQVGVECGWRLEGVQSSTPTSGCVVL